MPMDLVFVLAWLKSVIGRMHALYLYSMSLISLAIEITRISLAVIVTLCYIGDTLIASDQTTITSTHF